VTPAPAHAPSRVAQSRSRLLTTVELVLLLNALPAFVVLGLFPGKTADLFVWTVQPEASAHLLAVMYGNAAILAALTLARRSWPEVRVAFVVFTVFSLAATTATFFFLDPFLAHPRYFFVYWLCNYFFLCLVTPFVFVREELTSGGRLPVREPLGGIARAAAVIAAVGCLAAGIAMLVGPDFVAGGWPWMLTPLVARIIGVWLTALGLAFLWAVGDGDARRTRPIFVQALPTAVLIGLVPLLHRGDLESGSARYALFGLLVGGLAAAGAVGVVESRGLRGLARAL
jgi:hypothetical protein